MERMERYLHHTPDHEPVWLHDRCPTCGWLLRRAFNDVMPELELGPDGAAKLIERINEVTRELDEQIGAAS
jgi:hypothetical protein